MPTVRLDKVSLSFGLKPLLDNASLQVRRGERVCLLGRNGEGKSSLMQLITRGIVPDSGEVWVRPGAKVAGLAQEVSEASEQTVFDVVMGGAAQDHIDSGWQAEMQVDQVIARLELDRDAPMSALSGGWRRRVMLGRALVSEPDLLLLDEPTNHLDIDAITWLEDMMMDFEGALLFISHDRAFVRRLATRIVELDRGQLRVWPGSYDNYVVLKQAALETEAKHAALFDKKLAQEEVWIRKGVEARRTRSVGRIARLVEMRNERAERRNVLGNVKLDVGQGERSGKIVSELTDVTKKYGDRTIVDNFSATVMRGDKFGFIGPNGAGKTTLLKMILGELAPDTGTVRTGTNTQVAYFDQMRAQLDLDKTLSDTISPGSEWVEVNGVKKHVMSYLGDFLFAPERARSPVRSLSGGERNRLLLARLFARPANVLVLDEPTNDLDIQTLELLEELLTDYDGTVLLVSHDRQFLDNVVTSVFASEGGGMWREYVGGFTDWQIQRERAERIALDAARDTAKQAKKEDGPKDSGAGRNSQRSNKLPYKEVRELEALPAQIAALEAEQKSIAAKLEDGSVYTKDPKEGTRLSARHAAIDEELLVALERWEELEAKRK